ncbi:hypothetical protein [Persicirhabdus sediminis]|uniref:hypothetical protein n=1 Tax=Persicirhabdus sediminis TaxID=454144 RepID=UPI001F2ABAE7|nr:hypothetical protein [Persicirhabdus sediminis]
MAFILPLLIMVFLCLLIAELFYFNKVHGESKLRDGSLMFMLRAYVWFLLLAASIFFVPGLLYAAALEYKRCHGDSYQPFSWVFGIIVGVFAFYMFLPPLQACCPWDIAEGFAHLAGATITLGWLVPKILMQIGAKAKPAE